MVEDKELIRQYASQRSEAAFAELVRRHLKMVYAAALRQVNGDFQLAEDVAQAVFADLARKAARLQRHPSIAGWLHASTRFTAANAIRSETRRRAREQSVVALNEVSTNAQADWDEVRPIIDEALARLGDADREAVVLRYFESLEFPLVGTALGVSEGAARMRVERALDKLRGLLQRRGVATAGEALAGALAESTAIALPAHLATEITSTILSQGITAAAGSASSIFKLMIMKKIALAAIGLLALSAATVGVVKITHRLLARPSVTVLSGQTQATLGPGETLVMGGWPIEDGKRVFVLVTPVWIDRAGNKTQGPQGAVPQLTIESEFVEAPEADCVRLGLKPLFVAQNGGKEAVKYSSAQFRSLMDAFKTRTGADVLSAPRVTTLAGRQTHVASTEVQMIAGKAETLGPAVDLLPTVSSDGISVDLVAIVRVALATPR